MSRDLTEISLLWVYTSADEMTRHFGRICEVAGRRVDDGDSMTMTSSFESGTSITTHKN